MADQQVRRRQPWMVLLARSDVSRDTEPTVADEVLPEVVGALAAAPRLPHVAVAVALDGARIRGHARRRARAPAQAPTAPKSPWA
jgi:hypothetical protein